MGWPYQQNPPMGWPLDYDSGLVPEDGIWMLDEGSGVPYEQINSIQSTWTNLDRIGWVPGKYGWAISQSLDFGIFDTNTQFFDGTKPFSINIAVDYVDDGALQYVCNSNADAGIGYYFFLNDTTSRFVLYDGTSLWVSDQAATGNGFYDIVLTWDGSTAKVYFNGLLAGQDTTGAANAKAGTADLYLGSSGTGASALVDGKIHKCYQWNRALSPSEIAKLHRFPFCMYKDPAEVVIQGGVVAVGNAGIMTTNTGFWGETF